MVEGVHVEVSITIYILFVTKNERPCTIINPLWLCEPHAYVALLNAK
jgi:hypothetical protein